MHAESRAGGASRDSAQMRVIARVEEDCLHGRVSWTPVKGKRGTYLCKKHEQEFRRPNQCPMCTTADAEAVVERTEASLLAAEALRRGLPTMLDHEQDFLRIAAKAEAWAVTEKKAKRGANARNLLETAIKARTRAAEITEWREDWIRTERENAEGRDVPRPLPGSDVRSEMH
jgi:hypothetical protein